VAVIRSDYPTESQQPPQRRCNARAAAARPPGYLEPVVVGPRAVGVLVAGDGVVVVGVDVVGAVVVAVVVVVVVVVVVAVEDVADGAVPVAGRVWGGFVVVTTSEVSPETATKAAATPPRPSRKITVTTMIGTRQFPGGRMRVVAA
jgi:hypothetical protein